MKIAFRMRKKKKSILQSAPNFNLEIRTGTKSMANVSSRKTSSSPFLFLGGGGAVALHYKCHMICISQPAIFKKSNIVLYPLLYTKAAIRMKWTQVRGPNTF